MKKPMLLVQDALTRGMARPVPSYLEVDKEILKGALTGIPARDQIPSEVNEGLVMEHYTKYL